MSHPPAAGAPARRAAAFFDIDETLIRGASSYWLARELFRRGFASRHDIGYAVRQSFLYMLYGEKRSRVNSVVRHAMERISGTSVAQLRAISEDVYDRVIEPKLYAATLTRLRWHRQRGEEVWLLSATPWILADVIAQHVGATGAVGTRVKTQDGLMLPQLDGPIVHGRYKAQAMRRIAGERRIDLDRSWAYSDSANDLLLLQGVAHPVVVNADKLLAHVAQERDWEIMQARTRADALGRELWRLGIAAVGVGGTAGALYLGSRPLRRT